MWREPLTNRLFEVQYHTHEGSAARRLLRPQFFVFRSPVTDQKREEVKPPKEEEEGRGGEEKRKKKGREEEEGKGGEGREGKKKRRDWRKEEE